MPLFERTLCLSIVNVIHLEAGELFFVFLENCVFESQLSTRATNIWLKHLILEFFLLCLLEAVDVAIDLL